MMYNVDGCMESWDILPLKSLPKRILQSSTQMSQRYGKDEGYKAKATARTKRQEGFEGSVILLVLVTISLLPNSSTRMLTFPLFVYKNRKRS